MHFSRLHCNIYYGIYSGRIVRIKFVSTFSYRFCGYGNVLLFKDISEEDINIVESFVRDELYEIISSNAEKSIDADHVLLEEKQLIDYFGELYALSPGKFRFQSGDKKLIQMVINHVQSIFEKKGTKKTFEHFSAKTNS